jgi:hypothetical protein
MARRKRPARRHEISVQRHGKTYRAQYVVERGTVTVEAMSQDGTVAKLSTQAGGSARFTAHMLLDELIDAGRVLASEQ